MENLAQKSFDHFGAVHLLCNNAGSKHAVVAISEVLHTELTMRHSKIKVSVLCPAIVKIRMKDAEQNRPPELSNPPDHQVTFPESITRGYHGIRAEGETAGEMADQVFDALKNEKFYILPYPNFREPIRTCYENIMGEKDPTLPEDLLRRLGITEPGVRSTDSGSGIKTTLDS